MAHSAKMGFLTTVLHETPMLANETPARPHPSSRRVCSWAALYRLLPGAFSPCCPPFPVRSHPRSPRGCSLAAPSRRTATTCWRTSASPTCSTQQMCARPVADLEHYVRVYSLRALAPRAAPFPRAPAPPLPAPHELLPPLPPPPAGSAAWAARPLLRSTPSPPAPAPVPFQELLLPPPSAGFEVMRVALSDSDSEDIAFHFDKVRRRVYVGSRPERI